MAHFNKNALALAVAANMSFALPALAENTASAQEAGVVIVTGSKIDRPEDKTLASVEVITEDEIRAHGDQTLSDIISRTPGLYTQSDNEDWGSVASSLRPERSGPGIPKRRYLRICG
ncbi:TonB-dependent receptor plug domain-containing protein [Aliamphritea spongicola]|nr:TonB-dependent receptor plug domain-containing protein [Aliamphritea spongicola]